jgi:hypothetical protein
MSVQMTQGFASAVTVSIPIFALAAGAEARAIRERLKGPGKAWEAEFAEFSAEHELNPDSSAREVFQYFSQMPRWSKLRLAQRVLAVGSAVVWLVVFALLTVAELLSLVWLANGHPAGDGGLATFVLWSIAITMLTLILGPALYLAVPLLLPLDLVPGRLTRAVLPKAASPQGRNFLRRVFTELEGAVERAAEATEADAARSGQDDSGGTGGLAEDRAPTVHGHQCADRDHVGEHG